MSVVTSAEWASMLGSKATRHERGEAGPVAEALARHKKDDQ